MTKNKVQYFPFLKWFYDISHKNKHVNFYLYKNTLNLEINLYTITALDFNMGNCDIIKSSILCIFLKTFKNKDNNFSVVVQETISAAITHNDIHILNQLWDFTSNTFICRGWQR